ncbi:MerR family transcriptional regulator [Nocardia goodfellowii]
MTDNTKSGVAVGIGELARRTGLAVRTIRFYCDEGVLESQRSPGGHRMFDADDATDRLLLVRRLRALGLGLDSITDVLHGRRSMTEVIAAESARLAIEFKTLAWRQAALRAVATTSLEHEPGRLTLLAAAQDGTAVYNRLVEFWREVLAPLPRCDSDPWVCWNVPEPPAVPSVDDVVAYAELAALVAAPSMSSIVRQQYWRNRPEMIRDPRTLYEEVGEVMVDVVPLVAEAVPPYAGGELDRFVAAHARARGERDSPSFRSQLLSDATDTDYRIQRYWTLTEQFFPSRVTIGRAHDWLFNALADSTDRGPDLASMS